MNPPKDYDLFEVDLDRLDEQWVNHPKIYHYWAVQLADARAEWERAKARMEVVEAELNRDIRRNPADFGLEKITEDVVKQTVPLQKRYKEAYKEVIETKHDFDVIQANVSTLDTIKKALESLVALHIANYHSAPREPKNSDGRMEAATRKNAFSRKTR